MVTLINDLTDLQRFSKDMKDGWIITSKNDDDPHYIITCYSTATQFAGHWIQDTTLLTRGLVLRLTDTGTSEYARIAKNYGNASIDDIAGMIDGAQVAARGMRKFFTVDAAASDWGKVKLVDDDENVTVNDDYLIDYNAPASVADKLDGALGIGVIMDGDYIIATKGSFRSDEAIAGTMFMRSKHDSRAFAKLMTEQLPGFTPLFEIISPGDFHVVQYGDMADIVFLGLLEKATGWWVPAALLGTDVRTANTAAADIPARFKFVTPELYTARTLGDALALPALANHEGMVATLDGVDGKQDMFKIKYPMFLLLQRLKNSTSDKALMDYVNAMPADAIMNGDAPSIVDTIPVEAREAAQPILDRLNARAQENLLMPLRETVNNAITVFNKIAPEHDFTTREGVKDYAMEVNALHTGSNVRAILFALKNEAVRGITDGDVLVEAAVQAAKKQILKK